MPKTARSVSALQPPPIRHPNDVWSPRHTRSSPRQVAAERLVSSLGPAVLVEVDPARVRCDLDEPRPEAGAADVDVAQGNLAGYERQPVLVLLPAYELPGGEEHHGDHQDEQEPHDWGIGFVRPGVA